MKKEDIHIPDLWQLAFGEAPAVFVLEAIVGTLILYVCSLIIVRWLGKRMSGQLTIMELAVMFTLGAIVGGPMESPERGILQGIFLLICILFLQRCVTLISYYNADFEKLTQGKVPNIGAGKGSIRTTKFAPFAGRRSHNQAARNSDVQTAGSNHGPMA